MLEQPSVDGCESFMLTSLSNFVLGEKPSGSLPERVSVRIKTQQIQSERLISWVQLCLVLLFGLLYAIAPKTAADSTFNPVPWALGVYFCFTLVRLFLAYKSELPKWFLMSSVFLDMTLLMVLIWSFHIQYEQPPSFYLKTPTLIYVFIFIALRALRLEPGFILLAGLTAAAGWSLLVLLVVMSEAGKTMVTRDYITYMTSNSVLIGAEVDKIVSILLVTALLLIAAYRGQRMMHRSIQDSTAAQDLSKFVSKEVADVITSSETGVKPGDGESKVATVMFTDLEGFTTLSERLTPNDLAKLLNEYFDAMSKAIEAQGGVVNQFQGDAMLITYNAMTPIEDHAAAALGTAVKIQEICDTRTFLGERKIKLVTRCGVNTGEIIIGAIGSQERLTLTVHGDDVNIAARLEQLNKKYGTRIMCTDESRRASGRDYRFERLGNIAVKGKVNEVEVYSVRA